MLIDREEMDRRLNSANNIARPDHRVWRSHKPLSTPAVNRILDAPAGEKLKDTAEASGASIASVHIIRENQARDTAMDKLLTTLSLIDKGKLEDLSAKELAKVSSDMAGVYSKLGPQGNLGGNNIQVVVYAPEQRVETRYKSVEV